ncbi:MAG: DUF4129 domain-containing protein [Chloroflexota bacterium]|nr:DUF4129 domain-containing protein [Chloroflexota bacterium]
MNRTLWPEKVFRPVIVAVMVGAVFTAIVGLIRVFFPAWDGTYLVAGAVLASLEAHYSHFLIRRRGLQGVELLTFRLTEVGVLFLLIRLGSYIEQGWQRLWADIQYWPRHPLAFLIEPEPLSAFVLALIAWYMTIQTITDLEAIDMPLEPRERKGSSRPDAAGILYPHRFPPRDALPLDRFTGRFLFGGAIIVIATGLSRLNLVQTLRIEHPPVPFLVLNVLIYFTLGLVMLGQIRFAALRRQWWVEGIPITEEVAGRWVRYTLFLLAIAALVALLLPTEPLSGLLEAGAFVLDLFFWLISVVGMLILMLTVFPLLFLIWLLTSWLTLDAPIQRPTPPALPPPPSVVESAFTMPTWYEAIRFLLFWVVAGWALLYLIRTYLRDHPELQAALTSFGPLRALLRLLEVWWSRLRQLVRTIEERLPRQILPLRQHLAKRNRPFRRVRPRSLPPRQQVYYYYLRLLQCARQYGIPRRQAQTPYEYRDTLEPELPETTEAIEQLTQDFIAARYTQGEIDEQDVVRVKREAAEILAALRVLERRREHEDNK